jgi:putative transposase
MITCYRFRLYPKRSQVTAFERILVVHREIYNAALEERREAWRRNRVSIRYVDQANQLKEIRQIRADVADQNYSACQQTLRRVDQSFQNFFRRVKEHNGKAGYPRFKGKDRFNTVEFVYGDGCKIKGPQVYFRHVGQVRIVLHRAIEGTIKRCAFTRRGDKWFLVVTCETENITPANPPTAEVGIDLGLKSFAVLSTGEYIENPRFLRRDEKDLKRAQRKLSRCKLGSLERKRARRVVSRIHERIAKRRSNFAHQESRKIANRFGLVVFEDLAIQNLQANHCLAKSLADAAWNQFITYSTYKVERTGGRVVKIDRFEPSSRIHFDCGWYNHDLKLSDRTWLCLGCGEIVDRDRNAANNILALGRQSLPLIGKEAARL